MFKSRKYSNKAEFGQSLVEIALILPVLLIILAGTVEVSNLLITKNRVETAARAAARHASNGGDDSQIVVLNSVTQTLDLSEGLWDIWTIHAAINSSGTGFQSDGWLVEHVYGLGETSNYTTVTGLLSESCVDNCISTRLLEELQTDAQANENTTIAEDLEVVGVFVIHDIDSILGLSAMPAYQGLTSVEGFGVMRSASQTVVDTTQGCAVTFPFGVSNGIRSVDQTFYNELVPQMSYPATPPSYYSFSYHNPNQRLGEATDGDIFRYSFGNFEAAWLIWNQFLTPNSSNLAKSLAWPGNSYKYGNCSADGCTGLAGPDGWPAWGFMEVNDTNDREIHKNDRVAANLGGAISGVTAQLNDHINNNRALRIPVFEENFSIQYANSTPYYIVRDFGVFRIRGYSTSNNWILLEYVRMDSSCGQE
jgi:Flp pilus assembly protein TadG